MVTEHMDWKTRERYAQLRPEDLNPAEDGTFTWQRQAKRAEPAGAEA